MRRRVEGGDDPASGSSLTATTSSSSSSSGSLLPRLLKACARHRRRHDREADENKNKNDNSAGGGSSSSWCRDELSSFARVLLRMEGAIAPHRRSTNGGGYTRVVIRRCSRSSSSSWYRRGGGRILLPVPVPLDNDGGGDARDDGDVSITPGILPWISALLGHPSADPAGAAFCRRHRRMMSSVRRSCLCPRCCGPTTRVSQCAGICSTCRMTLAGWTIAVRSSIPLPHEGRRRRPPQEGYDRLGQRRRGRRVEDYHECKGGGGETR